MKILYFSGGYQFFQISPEIKSLYYRAKKIYSFVSGEALFGTAEVILANVSIGEATRAHFTGALGQGGGK